jgi:putative iron-regulated protein
VLLAYSRAAFAGYAEAVDSLESLERAVRRLRERPTRQSMEEARAAWVACRAPYSRTETFRFSSGPIDAEDPGRGTHGPEGRINAWPIDEAFLDYVHQQPRAGLVSARGVPLDEASLVSRNAAADDRQVTLGYHAIEFLLWGQDRSAEGPGARPFADYLPGDPIRERRRACLALVVDLLLRDLRGVRDAWDPARGQHAQRFLATDARVALGRALSGPATLAAFELASERLGVPLSSGEQEDEESCFSDNSHRDLAANIEGIARVLEGQGEAPGLVAALRSPDADDLRQRIARVRRLAARVPAPFDQALVAPPEDPRRAVLQALLGELIELAGAIQRGGDAAGVRVEIAR